MAGRYVTSRLQSAEVAVLDEYRPCQIYGCDLLHSSRVVCGFSETCEKDQWTVAVCEVVVLFL